MLSVSLLFSFSFFYVLIALTCLPEHTDLLEYNVGFSTRLFSFVDLYYHKIIITIITIIGDAQREDVTYGLFVMS